MSSRPNFFTVSATAFFTALASALSARIARAFPPPDTMSRTTSSAFDFALEYVIATAAPSTANRFAIAAPIPHDPPVTRATLPASVFVISAPPHSMQVRRSRFTIREDFYLPACPIIWKTRLPRGASHFPGCHAEPVEVSLTFPSVWDFSSLPTLPCPPRVTGSPTIGSTCTIWKKNGSGAGSDGHEWRVVLCVRLCHIDNRQIIC